MKVLQLSTSDYGGGAERVARDLHAAFRKQGWRAHLLAGRCRKAPPEGVEALYERDWPTRAWSRVRFEWEAATGRQASTSKAFENWWRVRKAEWDVVLCHNLHGVYFDLDILPALCAERPVFAVLHDLWLLTGHCAFPYECDGFRRGCGSCPHLRSLPRVWFDRTAREWDRKMDLLLRARPTLVCVSEWAARQVAASGLRDLRTVVVRNGLPDLPIVGDSKASVRRRLGWPVDKLIYLYVSSGGLQGGTQYKDPRTLIEAARNLVRASCRKDAVIVTAGGRRELDPEVSGMFLQYDHISSGLQDFYAAADVFVFPTKAESLPLVLIEAARAGLPTVTVDVAGCAEVVQHGATGLVVAPQNPIEFARAMETIATMDLVSMGRRARERYLAEFTEEQMVDAYQGLLLGAASVPRRTPALSV